MKTNEHHFNAITDLFCFYFYTALQRQKCHTRYSVKLRKITLKFLLVQPN